MAFEANLSDFTIYAYTVDLNQNVQPLNVNFLDFFCIFLSHLIRMNGKMAGEGLKVEKVAKWATLRMRFPAFLHGRDIFFKKFHKCALDF